MEDDKEKALQELQDLSNLFTEAMDRIKEEEEAYWNSLSKKDQLKAFCAVIRRVHQAELIDKGTYRYALYNVFGFGPESYAPAQMAGFLDIHNSIFDYDHEFGLLEAFCVKYNIEDAEKKITEFLI